MSNNQHKTPLSERFSEYGSTPSDAVWTAIDTQLTAQRSKNKGLIFWVSANAAMLGLVIFTFTLDAEKGALANEITLLSTENSTENKAEKTETPIIKKELQSQEKATYNLFGRYSSTQPIQTNYLNKDPQNSTMEIEKSPSENPNIDPLVDQTSASFSKIDVLPIIGVKNLVSDHERNLLVCSRVPSKRFRTFEFGARFATFSEIIESERTVAILPVDPSQMNIGSFTTDSGNYAHNYGHRRQFEFEIFTRGHVRRFYYTVGLSVAKTRVDELYGNSESGFREFVTKDITSFGAPISVGFNFIDLPRFQFSLATRIIPEFSLLKNYESNLEGPVFTTSTPPQPITSYSQEHQITSATTLGLEPHLSMNFKLNERLDLFGQFGYRTGLIRSSLFSTYFTPNFTAFSVGTVIRF